MEYDKIKEISEKVISEIENNPDLEGLSNMIKADFLYLTTERDYLSLDVNNYDFRDDHNGQGFLLTFEDDNDTFKTVLWDYNGSESFGEDIKKGLLAAQNRSIELTEEYNVNYISENTHKKKITL